MIWMKMTIHFYTSGLRNSVWIAVLHSTVILARITHTVRVWNVPMLVVKIFFTLLSINATSRHLFPFNVIWCCTFSFIGCKIIKRKTKYGWSKLTNAIRILNRLTLPIPQRGISTHMSLFNLNVFNKNCTLWYDWNIVSE